MPSCDPKFSGKKGGIRNGFRGWNTSKYWRGAAEHRFFLSRMVTIIRFFVQKCLLWKDDGEHHKASTKERAVLTSRLVAGSLELASTNRGLTASIFERGIRGSDGRLQQQN
jgi:hypothetical protein